MNILILLFTLFCLIYSGSVLIYLIFIKKKENKEGPITSKTLIESELNPDYISSRYVSSNQVRSPSNKLRSFQSSEQLNPKQNMYPNKNILRKTQRNFQRNGTYQHLGFSQIRIPKPISKVNGILKNGTNKSKCNHRFM
jgi:hypothetical protein